MILQEYYNILGVKKESSLKDLKRAFKKKAKEYHSSNNSDADEQFVLLFQAFEFLSKIKSLKKPDEVKLFEESWERSGKNSKLLQAKTFFEMSYSSFINSEFYMTVFAVESVFNAIYFISGALAISVLPIVATILKGTEGLIISLVGIFITTPVIVNALRDTKFNLHRLILSVKFLLKSKSVYLIALIILNIYLIFRIDFRTLIKPVNLTLIFSIALVLSQIATTYILNKRIKKPWTDLLNFGLIPLVINLLFLCNYVFSSQPQKEEFVFKNKIVYTLWGSYESTSIILHDDSYSEYPGIRIFPDYDEMKGSYNICYTFEEGLLGLRVLKSYEFQ